MIVHKNSLRQTISAATVFAVVSTVALVPNAHSAPKQIAVKQLSLLAKDASAEGMVVTNKAVVTYSNVVGNTSDIQVRAIDFAGAEIWSKTIDSGWDEVATAINVDTQGSIWLAGNSATGTLSESNTAIVGALNPDSVTAEATSELRADMTNIALWQFSASGELLSQVNSTQVQPAIVDGLSANATGVSILLSRDNGQSIFSLKAGIFSKELKLGTIKSKFKAILRGADGSTSLFGSSSETLGGKKLVGKEDGILLKVSKTGSISSVVRSSATSATRDWQSATSSNFLTGIVKSGKKIETALTKFNSSFTPTWTARYASTGVSFGTLGANGSVFAIFEPTAVPKGITGWKVIKGQSVTLQLDSKGALVGAFTNSLLATPISTGYSAEGGLIVLTKAGDLLRVAAR